MKFVVSSNELLNHLMAVNRVISSKNTLPILDNFLFNLEENELTITASDLESTLITKMELENTQDSGNVAIPAKLIIDTLKEFPEQPLTFEIDIETLSILINSSNGKFTIVGQSGEEFPQIPDIKPDSSSNIQVPTELLHNGINKTLFATADDEMRPIMNGIFVELSEENISFAASDSHKLVRYRRYDAKSDGDSSFILPKKPAAILNNILPREKGNVLMAFDDKNVSFSLPSYTLVCRLVEGQYPSYNAVIPADNPNKLTIDRVDLLTSIKRVGVFSNQASNLIKLDLTGNQLTVSAQDLDFSISAYERLNCQYEGDEMEIGFKSTFLVEILSNLSSPDVVVELADGTRAGLILPTEKENEEEDVLMLLMPMSVSA